MSWGSINNMGICPDCKSGGCMIWDDNLTGRTHLECHNYKCGKKYIGERTYDGIEWRLAKYGCYAEKRYSNEKLLNRIERGKA